MMDIILTLLINSLPIVILFMPCLLFRKKIGGKLYFRIIAGIAIFYVIYWILPIIFQIGSDPVELSTPETESDMVLGIEYLIAHFGSLISLYAFYPLVTLPFIFFMAPLVSIVIVWNKLRKQDGTLQDNLEELTFEFSESPYEQIKSDLKQHDWSREKQILKLMMVLLPISLYLLQVILDISNLQNVSLTTGETALGWFIEILFVYLAIFIFGIELLYSARIAFKGRYIGDEIRENAFRGLYSVGAPISILSIILFIIQYTSSIFIILYFFAYFFMASILFILFLNIFEPISIYIFVKVLDWWNNREEKIEHIDYTNNLYVILAAIGAVIIYFLVYSGITVIYVTLFENPAALVQSSNFTYENPTLLETFGFDVLNIFNFLALTLIPLVISAWLFSYGLQFVKSKFVGIISFLPIIIIASILFLFIGINPIINFAPEEYWVTGQSSYTDIFGFTFFTLRTATFDASLVTEGGGYTLLGILAFPYLYTRYIFNIIIWTLLISYLRKYFKTKNVPRDEKEVEKIVFSTISEFLTLKDYLSGTTRYLISKTEDAKQADLSGERKEVKKFMSGLHENKLLSNIVPEEDKEKRRFYYVLKFLYSQGLIQIWRPEFSYTYERVKKQALYIMYSDGRDVFNYPFEDAELQDPALISGMFSAISSFIKETTRSQQTLKTIDHGDITILIEYGDYIFGALFIKGNQTSEIRAKLKTFINEFEDKHGKLLEDWNGALKAFQEDDKLVERIFTEE
ncbi:MAG: hypothetical protein ACOC4M_09220 [Promethearchaeia archaeon]